MTNAWLVVAVALFWYSAYRVFTPKETPRLSWRTRTHVRTIPKPYDHEKELS